MLSDATIGCNEETLGDEDESFEGIKYMRAQISRLSAENDRYKQELHELHRKLEISRTMEAELAECHKASEQSLEREKARNDRRIHEMEEKHLGREKELRDKLTDMEVEMAERVRENGDLRDAVRTMEEKLSSLDRSQNATGVEDDCELLKQRIERLTELWSKEAEDERKKQEETVRAMTGELEEMREIVAATKRQLAEREKAAESAREELFQCRMELESSKVASSTDGSKGNSLFAEVEDRRKVALDRMNAMRAGYLEVKRSLRAKEAEIKSLKAERCLLLRKLEDDATEKILQDASLVEKYKARIGQLEMRLGEETRGTNKRNTKGQETSGGQFTYLQSLVDAKNREIEELTRRIENDAVMAVLDEEKKHKMGRELRYWRYRAMSSQAELVSIKDSLTSGSSDRHVAGILRTIEKRLNEMKHEPNETSTPDDQSTVDDSKSADVTIVALDTRTNVPRAIDATRHLNSSNFDEPEIGGNASADRANVSMEETAVINGVISMKETAVNNDVAMEETAVVNTVIPMLARGDGKIGESGYPSFDDSTELEREANARKDDAAAGDCSLRPPTRDPILKSVLSDIGRNATTTAVLPGKETSRQGREKKTLTFACDTIEPNERTLKKESSSAPKYPIVFISSNKSKDT